MKKKNKQKIDEVKQKHDKEIKKIDKKYNGGICKESLEEKKDAEESYQNKIKEIEQEDIESKVTTKLKKIWTFIEKKWKILGGIGFTIIVLITLLNFLLPFFEPNTETYSETYVKDVVFERNGDNLFETFNFTIGCKGSAPSKNVVFEIETYPDLAFNESNSGWERDPDEVVKEFWFVKLKWNEIPTPDEIKISLNFDIVGTPPNSGVFAEPKKIIVNSEGEQNPIYIYP